MPSDSGTVASTRTGAVPSGRPYSIRDLIRMFDVRVTINQKDMTAVMFRDFGTK